MNSRSPFTNNAAALFVASMLVVVSATAQEPPHISDEAVNELYHRVESQRLPQEVASLDHQFRAVYRQTHPGRYGRNFGRVTILDRDGRVLASYLLADNGGRLVAVAHWSPDSKLCVFTTISAGGHSPWQFKPYVFSVASRTFRFLGDSFEAVIDPEFHFAAPDTVLFTTRQGVIPLQLNAIMGASHKALLPTRETRLSLDR